MKVMRRDFLFRKKLLIETPARSPAILISRICIWLHIRHRKALPLSTFKLLEKLARVGLAMQIAGGDIYFPARLLCHGKNVCHVSFIIILYIYNVANREKKRVRKIIRSLITQSRSKCLLKLSPR